ncbi:MAG: hypothetical protein GY698_01225 [Actinomycetia bacterium]|nr:hypothetical protein [Actinomycetes bacterium]
MPEPTVEEQMATWAESLAARVPAHDATAVSDGNPPRVRWSRFALVGAVAGLVAALVLVVWNRDDDSQGLISVPPAPTTSVAPTPTPTTVVPVESEDDAGTEVEPRLGSGVPALGGLAGETTMALAEGHGHLWISGYSSDRDSRGQVTGERFPLTWAGPTYGQIEVSTPLGYLASSESYVWGMRQGDGGLPQSILVRYEPATGELRELILDDVPGLGFQKGGLTADDEGAWITGGYPDETHLVHVGIGGELTSYGTNLHLGAEIDFRHPHLVGEHQLVGAIRNRVALVDLSTGQWSFTSALFDEDEWIVSLLAVDDGYWVGTSTGRVRWVAKDVFEPFAGAEVTENGEVVIRSDAHVGPILEISDGPANIVAGPSGPLVVVSGEVHDLASGTVYRTDELDVPNSSGVLVRNGSLWSTASYLGLVALQLPLLPPPSGPAEPLPDGPLGWTEARLDSGLPQWVTVIERDSRIDLVRVDDGRRHHLGVWPENRGRPARVQVGPDGWLWIASWSEDHDALDLWALAPGQVLAQAEKRAAGIDTAIIAVDGRVAVTRSTEAGTTLLHLLEVDGPGLAFEREGDNPYLTDWLGDSIIGESVFGDTSEILMIDVSDPERPSRIRAISSDALIPETCCTLTPVFRADGNIVTAPAMWPSGPDWLGVVADPVTGEPLATFPLGINASGFDYDPTRTYLLYHADGELRWQGAGEMGVIPGAGSAVAWGW